MTKIAVILSGCGYLDGAEIRESVLALLALDKAGAEVTIFAPDRLQSDVVNHLTGHPVDEIRNVMVEAARVARGDIQPLYEAKAEDFDALIMPGGYGVAKNLSDLATKGADCSVDSTLDRLITDFLTAKKPIGAICISPAILAASINGKTNATMTIGDDEDGLIKALGSTHQNCRTDQCVIDAKNKIVTSSAYMRDDAPLYEIFLGIDRLVQAVMKLAQN